MIRQVNNFVSFIYGAAYVNDNENLICFGITILTIQDFKIDCFKKQVDSLRIPKQGPNLDDFIKSHCKQVFARD